MVLLHYLVLIKMATWMLSFYWQRMEGLHKRNWRNPTKCNDSLRRRWGTLGDQENYRPKVSSRTRSDRCVSLMINKGWIIITKLILIKIRVWLTWLRWRRGPVGRRGRRGGRCGGSSCRCRGRGLAQTADGHHCNENIRRFKIGKWRRLIS